MMRILIADDHAVVRQGLATILAREFPQLLTGEANDSNEAVDLLRRQSWDLLLLDLNMPGRGGLDVLTSSRRMRPGMPVLVISAYPEEEFAVRAFQLGAVGYLSKQSAPDELVLAVRRVLSGGKYVTALMAERLVASLGGELRLPPHETLSSRELRVLRLVATGSSLKEIAAELSLSEKTIQTYRSRISGKLGLSTNVELTRYAFQNRLVD